MKGDSFGGINPGQMLKNLQSMQNKLSETLAKQKDKRFEGVSGGGLVKVVVNGNGELVDLSIDLKSILADDGEDNSGSDSEWSANSLLTCDLVKAAYQNALSSSQKEAQDSAQGIMNGTGLPGGGDIFNDLLSKL